MEILQKMISTQAVLFLYMAAGMICRACGIITEKSRGYFNALLVRVTLPAMICASFFTKRTLSELASAGMMLLISAGVCLFAYVFARFLWRRADVRRRGALQFATMFSNAGNAGLPVVSMVFGETGVLYASFFLVPIRVCMWTLGLACFISGEGRGKVKKLLTNPCFVAVFVGIAVMLSPLRLPEAVQSAVGRVGDMTGPLSMMIIGSTLAQMRPRDLLDRGALAVSFLRLLAIPLLLLLLLRALCVPALLEQVSVTLLAMPVATLTVVFADTYGGDSPFASRCVFLSTLLSLFTVPLITLLF